MEHLLETKGLGKCFGTFWANKNINFHLDEHEIVSLLGENGAGKTTLMNMLYGLYKPDAGSILIAGRVCDMANPKVAIENGISMVHQHFMLVDSLTVVENIIVGNEPEKGHRLDIDLAVKKVTSLSEKYGLGIDPKAEVGALSVGEKQRVELLKALYNDCRVLILDEPTAVLTPSEVDAFFAVLKKLKEAGPGIVLISHKLKETLEIADRIYILRNGEITGEAEPRTSTVDSLSALMVGRPLSSMVSKNDNLDSSVVFSFKNISYKDKRTDLEKISSVTLGVKSGQILGIAGVDGNGQTELIDLAIGLKKPTSGSVVYLGENISLLGTGRRIRKGIGYISEDRQAKGLVTAFDLQENLILGYQRDSRFSDKGIINWKKVKNSTEKVIEGYDVRCTGVSENAALLSGGNQQKFIIGRVLESDPNIIIAAQPTRGVDIGAIEYIHKKLVGMRNKGKAILLISADLDEIMKLSDEIAVIYEGRIVSDAPNGTYTKTELGLFMTGGRTSEE